MGFIGIKYIYEIAKVKKELDYDFISTDLEQVVKVNSFSYDPKYIDWDA